MCGHMWSPSCPCCQGTGKSLPGVIARHMRPQIVSDYADLATAAWSFGETGHPQDNLNCAYYHWIVDDWTTQSHSVVLPPVRWTIAAPSQNGGTFDWFEDAGDVDGGFYDPEEDPTPDDPTLLTWQQGRDGTLSALHVVNWPAIRSRFMPDNWHCRFVDGKCGVSPLVFPTPLLCTSKQNDGVYDETAFLNLAPGVTPYSISGGAASLYPPGQIFGVDIAVEAIQLRRNGRKLGPIVQADDNGLWSDRLVTMRETDQLSVDVWYRIGFPAQPLQTPGARRGCVYVPFSRVDNGSEKLPFPTWHLVPFYNVDFCPDFDPETQTYQFTAHGHRGWNLNPDGSNLLTLDIPGAEDEGYDADFPWSNVVGSGSATLTRVGDLEHPVRSIAVYWDREIAELVADVRSEDTGLFKRWVYRSAIDADQYIQNTVSVEFGAQRHAPAGRFDSSGTTDFRLVRFSDQVEVVYLDGVGAPISGPWQVDAEATTGDDPDIPANVPRRITVTRVQRQSA